MPSPKEQANYQAHQELGGIEMVNANFHHHNFSKHSHDTYTINIIEKGCQRFQSGKQNFIAPEHSIIFVNADEVHTGQSATEKGWSYRGISPSEYQFNQLANDIGLAHNFAPFFKHAVVEDKQLASELQVLFNTLSVSKNSLLRETMLYGVLTRLMLKHGKHKQDINIKQALSTKLDWVRQYIHEHLEENISLSDLATLCDISPFYLIKQFQKQYGLPPHAYQIQRRLHQSKILLKQGKRVVQAATQVGFYDQSHFHRHFKRANGITPSQYARQVM